MGPAIGHREGRLGYHAWKRYTEFGSGERLRRKARQLDLETRPQFGEAEVDEADRGVIGGENNNMLSKTAVRSGGLQERPRRDIDRIRIYREMTSVAAMMLLAADRIAAIVLAADPELRDALYRKYFGRFARVAPVAWRGRSGRSASDARLG
jgi:hypothetical protein